ncbi:hypothetical protein Q4610_18820 [Sphingobium sp. HBC34]|uniref:Uncharacterized protein n=1 Tax=Sphingobium cyanobacteriorum TaxID=3063954 RepID=A0ABT8ZUG3_9SPHN|nr:hypothetical protein [Sphingobium sp. HBC34]MDO7837101.1 hypothetical protein [Sphingobium sp. HBC34]
MNHTPAALARGWVVTDWLPPSFLQASHFVQPVPRAATPPFVYPSSPEGRVSALVPLRVKAILVEAVKEMEKAKGTGRFVAAYQKFMGLIADHQGVITPFHPALARFMAG